MVKYYGQFGSHNVRDRMTEDVLVEGQKLCAQYGIDPHLARGAKVGKAFVYFEMYWDSEETQIDTRLSGGASTIVVRRRKL